MTTEYRKDNDYRVPQGQRIKSNGVPRGQRVTEFRKDKEQRVTEFRKDKDNGAPQGQGQRSTARTRTTEYRKDKGLENRVPQGQRIREQSTARTRGRVPQGLEEEYRKD